jgi:hypothetical protein
VLVSGVYGVGKTSLVEEMAYVLEHRGRSYAAIDVDWLGWFSAQDEKTESRVLLANLADIVERYLAAGVHYLALAHSVPDAAALADVRVAVRVPLKVVGLELPHEDIRGRLDHAVTRGREDDLRAAAEWLALGRGSGFEDLLLPSDRPVSTLAAEVLDWLGWV